MAQVLFVFILILIELFWLIQMIDLMRASDGAFVGKHDKILWVAVLLLANFLGAFAYFIAKPRPETVPTISTEKFDENYPERCLKCGEEIPPHAKKCLSCGWSYQNKQ